MVAPGKEPVRRLRVTQDGETKAGVAVAKENLVGDDSSAIRTEKEPVHRRPEWGGRHELAARAGIADANNLSVRGGRALAVGCEGWPAVVRGVGPLPENGDLPA